MCTNAISIYSYASLSPFKPVKSQISCYAIVKAVIKGGYRFGVGGPWTLWRTKPRGKKGRAFMRERLTSLNGNHNLYFSVTFFTRLINQGGRQTTERLCEEVYAAGTKNYYVLTFFTCGLLASIRWSKFCVLIDFPSGQEGSLYVLWFNFILGLKFIFLCFKEIHYHGDTLSYPKTKEHKIKTKDKIEPQHTPNCIYVVIKKAKDK